MISELTLWKAVFSLALWLGLAGMKTGLDVSAEKASPLGLMPRFFVWLLIMAPGAAFAGLQFFVWIGWIAFFLGLLASSSLTATLWKVTPALPVVGLWFQAVKQSETKRVQRGYA